MGQVQYVTISFFMSLWEYKVITSGKGGFATPAMLEKFLNDLGRDEWEIIHYHSTPDNLLAFTVHVHCRRRRGAARQFH